MKKRLRSTGETAGMKKWCTDCNAAASNALLEINTIKEIKILKNVVANITCGIGSPYPSHAPGIENQPRLTSCSPVNQPGVMKRITPSAATKITTHSAIKMPSITKKDRVINLLIDRLSPAFTMVTIVGTKDADTAPSAKILRKELGILKAVTKASTTTPGAK